MKKIVINISDSVYEKLRFETILQKKSIQEVIHERVFYKPFDNAVEEAFDKLSEKELKKMMEI